MGFLLLRFGITWIVQILMLTCHASQDDYKAKCTEPVVGTKISDFKVKPFNAISLGLPHDAFIGDDHTVSLSLTTSTTKCWYKFEPMTSTLNLLIDRDVIKAKPAGGYVFKLTGTSNCDSSIESSQTFRIIIEQDKQVSCMEIEVALQVKEMTTDACALHVMNDIILRTGGYLSHGADAEHILCQLQDYQLNADGYLSFVFGFKVNNHARCQELCNRNFFRTFAKRIVDEFGKVNENFAALLDPRYTVYSGHASIGCQPTSTTKKPTSKSQSTPTPSTATLTSPKTTHYPPLSTQHCYPPLIKNRINDILLNSAFRPHINTIPSDVFGNQQELQLSLHLVSHVPSHSICWLRFSSPNIFSFPTNNTVVRKPSGGYRYALTAVNSCGLSSSIEFNVDIKNLDFIPCYVFETTVGHPQNLCEEKILKEFYDALRWIVRNNHYGELYVTEIRGLQSRQRVIRYMVTKLDGKDCRCTETRLNQLKTLFSLENLRKLFASSTIVKNIEKSNFLNGPSRCGVSCGDKQKVIAQTARAGIINELVLPLTSSTKYTLSKEHEDNQHVCLVHLEQPRGTVLLFLPPKQIGPYYSLTNHKFKLFKESSTTCPAVVSIHASPLSEVPCYHITIRYKVLKPFPCSLLAVKEMILVLAKYYRVRTDQIILLQYSASKSKDDVTTEIALLFTFTHDIISCSKCAPALIETYIGQIVGKGNSVAEEFNLLIAQKFQLLNMSYLIYSSSGLTDFLDSHYSQSYIPLWVYLLPVFLGLLLLLCFLLSCCFCCRGRENRSLSSCCLPCCIVSGDNTKSGRRRRAYQTSSYPSVYHVSSRGGGEGEKNSLTKHKSIDSINSIYIKGLGGTRVAAVSGGAAITGKNASSSSKTEVLGKATSSNEKRSDGSSQSQEVVNNVNATCSETSTEKKSNDTGASTIIPIVSAPSHGEQNTKMIYAQVNKSHNDRKVEVIKAAPNGDDDNPIYAPPRIYKGVKRGSMEDDDRTPGSYTIDRLSRLRSTGKSTSGRPRSFSDGDLLDDDDEYLDLPIPPPGQQGRADSIPRRRYSRRVSHRYRCRDDSAIDNDNKIKLTIPVKLTARVKSISRSLDNGLDNIRPTSSSSYVRFTEPLEERRLFDREPTKYESSSISVEEHRPLSRSRKHKPSYHFSSKSPSNIDVSSSYKRKDSSGDSQDDDFSTYKKTVEKRVTKTTKHYPWEKDDFWKSKAYGRGTDFQSHSYPWKRSTALGGSSIRRKDKDLFTGSTKSRKYVKFDGIDGRYTEV